MKACPTCNRTYEDDTLAFCLDDGARLSVAYDPHATLLGPAARDADPPRTAILPPGLTPDNQAPSPLRSVIPASAPLAYSQATARSQLTEKRRGKLWIILSGVFALIVVGLVILLGYLAWRINNQSITEPSRAGSTVATNSNMPANANRESESGLTDNARLQWFDGVWEGEGYQSDTSTTWAVRLTAQDGAYEIEYPNIPCRGRWDLIDNNSIRASFTEVITEGTDRCGNNSHVMIEKVNDSEISCKYTHARSRVVIASVVLSKKAQLNRKR